MQKDDLGDRMKSYEQMADRRLMTPRIPVMARLDGWGFSKFTAGLEKPYDERLHDLMVCCTKLLVKTFNANVGYTQSDEISLCWYTLDNRTNVPQFAGRVQKTTSLLSSFLTGEFNRRLAEFVPEKADKTAFFDCRVWNVPNVDEAANTFLWREQDATKNSISSATRVYYRPSEMLGKNGAQMQEMLHQMGVNWNDYPAFFKRGTYVGVRSVTEKYNAAELLALPSKHAARRDPNLLVTRSKVQVLNLPKLHSIANRVGVLLKGEDPVLKADLVGA